MSKKPVNVEVSLKEVGGCPHRLIKKFIKKCKKERIIEDYLDRRFYVKPSKKRRIEKARKLQNARKANSQRNKKLDKR
jgi:ribosomal protein S21